MAYNKAKAEKEWVEWKNNEEKQLRELGVDEDTIQQLHGYDWEAFKADRRYRERNSDIEQIPDCPAQELPEVVQSVTELMENIENERLYDVLKNADKETLQILVYKMEGYSSKEIAVLMGIPELAINSRMARMRKKLKNIF